MSHVNAFFDKCRTPTSKLNRFPQKADAYENSWQLEFYISNITRTIDTHTHPSSLFPHWSITSSNSLCWHSAHVSTRNKPLPQFDSIPDWYLIRTLLHHAHNAVFHRIYVRPHVRFDELRFSRCTSLICVTMSSAMLQIADNSCRAELVTERVDLRGRSGQVGLRRCKPSNLLYLLYLISSY